MEQLAHEVCAGYALLLCAGDEFYCQLLPLFGVQWHVVFELFQDCCIDQFFTGFGSALVVAYIQQGLLQILCLSFG